MKIISKTLSNYNRWNLFPPNLACQKLGSLRLSVISRVKSFISIGCVKDSLVVQTILIVSIYTAHKLSKNTKFPLNAWRHTFPHHHYHLHACPILNPNKQQNIPSPQLLLCTQALCAPPLTARLPLPSCSIPNLAPLPLACAVSLSCPTTFSILILRPSAQQQQQGHQAWGCAAAQQQSHTTQESRGCAG